jgi:AcrR family transcriptional regulator
MARTPKRSLAPRRALEAPAPHAGARLATAKSQRTHDRIIAAAIESFIAIGYARTSMSGIAARAGLTRSRVQYYFANTEELLTTATQTLLSRVWGRYLDRLHAAVTLPDDAFESLMALRKNPEHIAWMELVVASRTDPVLRRIVERAQCELDRQSLHVQRHLLSPQTPADAERLGAIADLVRLVLEGLTLSVIADDRDRRIERALRALKIMLGHYWRRPPAAGAASA